MDNVMNFGGESWISFKFLSELLGDLPSGYPSAMVYMYLYEKASEEFQKGQ